MSRPLPAWRGGALLVAGLLAGCTKVPLEDVVASFARADAAWFAEEDTLFFFYEVRAEQGISRTSVLEVSWVTDDGGVSWTPLEELPAVHDHVAADCGPTAMCGSWSVAEDEQPRSVQMRLRYHEDGEMVLDASRPVFNVVGPGAPHSNRSLLIYGVFDEANRRAQWRARHQFPTVRNEQATALGLRRRFRVADAAAGTVELSASSNPYGYGAVCPSGMLQLDLDPVETTERAAFQERLLPTRAAAASGLCAQATVWDARGRFTTGALARKNPEVRPAFPELRSPITEAVPLQFWLAPCDRALSPAYAELQQERLQLDRPTEICTDGWEALGFEDQLVRAFDGAIEAARPDGRDTALVIGLNQDQPGLSEVVEAAIEAVAPDERDRSSPRLVGAFVFDSEAYAPASFDVARTTLWCPAKAGGSLASAATAACTVIPDTEFVLGPLSVDTLPILPTRDEYLDFVATYSADQAGEVRSLEFLAPTFSTTTDHVDFGEIGVVTFLNDEVITADLDDAFSYCRGDTPDLFAFRSPLLEDEAVQRLVREACREEALPAEVCEEAAVGALPLQLLGDWHASFSEGTYDLGVFWQFPFLLRMEVEVVAAGNATVLGLSLPFGFAGDGEQYLGSPLWEQDTFSLEELLTQCDRFCDHPTFDSAGIYQVRSTFRETYAQDCYQPVYAAVGDGGFPRDP